MDRAAQEISNAKVSEAWRATPDVVMVVKLSRNVCPICTYELSLFDKCMLFFGSPKNCCNCGTPYTLVFSLLDRIAFTIIFIAFSFVQNFMATLLLPYFSFNQISVVSWSISLIWIVAYIFFLKRVRMYPCREMKLVVFEFRILKILFRVIVLLLLAIINYVYIKDFYFYDLPALILSWAICLLLMTFNFSGSLGIDNGNIFLYDIFRNRLIACDDIERLSFKKVLFVTFLKAHLYSGKSYLLLVCNKLINQSSNFLVRLDVDEVIAKLGLSTSHGNPYSDSRRKSCLLLFQISLVLFVSANILIASFFGTNYKNWYDINKVLLSPEKINGSIFSAGSGLSVHNGAVERVITADKVKLLGIEFPKGAKFDFENGYISAATSISEDFSACGEKWSSRSTVFFQKNEKMVFFEPNGRNMLGQWFPRASVFVYQGCHLDHIQIGDANDIHGVLLPKDSSVVFQNNEIAFIDIKGAFTFQDIFFLAGGVGVFNDDGIFSLESHMAFKAYEIDWPAGTTFVPFTNESAELVVSELHKVEGIEFAKDTAFSFSRGKLVAATVEFPTTFLNIVWPPGSVFYYTESGLSEIGTIGKVKFHGNIFNKASYLLGGKQFISKVRFTEPHSYNGEAYKSGAVFNVFKGRLIFEKYAP